MKKVFRHIFPDGTESISDSKKTVLIVNKQEPIRIVEDSVYEEHYNKKGLNAMKDRDEERKKEKEEKDKLEKEKQKE